MANILPTFVILLTASLASAYTVDRRTLINSFGAATTVAFAPITPKGTTAAVSPPTLESIYIGCGCFWHLQHSIAVFERDQLGRKGSQLTCKAGYAGGKKQPHPM